MVMGVKIFERMDFLLKIGCRKVEFKLQLQLLQRSNNIEPCEAEEQGT